jgi:hypothetical protein
MERVLRITLLPVLLLLGGIAWGQEISFTAKVDRTNIAAGEPLQLTITLVNAQGNISAPELGGLVIQRGPFPSTDIKVFNGRMVTSVSHTWVLTANRPGKYTIGPARVQVGGGVISTEPITIEVGAAAAQPQEAQAAQGQSRDVNLFATISVSKNKAYVGDQVVATYTLYSRYANLDLAQYDLPKLNGFWTEDVPMGNANWEDKLETINGMQYKVAILKRQVLFPQKSGKLRIEPFTLTCVVNRSFFNRGTSIDLKSNAVELTVQDLPPNAPPGFSGAVGELQMTVKADRTSIKADEAIELTVRFNGRSNLKLLEAPSIAFPSDFEVYDPKVTDKISVNGGGMSGQREFQYLVIPRFEGLYELEPVTFSYFDTKAGGYKTLRGEAMTVDVAQGAGGAGAAIQRPTKTDVKVLGTDIRYIRQGPLELRPVGHQLFGSVKWFAGMGAPALAFVFLLVWRRKQLSDQADATGMRRKRADKVARERLRQAADALKQNAREPFYTALSKALHGYLADKLGIGVAEVSASQLHERLSGYQEGPALAADFAALITTCDMARFAPTDDRPRQELYDEAARLIGRAEQHLRA